MASSQTRKRFPLVFAPEGTVRTFDPRNEVAVHENAPTVTATENYHTGRPAPPQSNPGLKPNQRWNANASKNYVPTVINEFQRKGLQYTPEMAAAFVENSTANRLSSTLATLSAEDIKINKELYDSVQSLMDRFKLSYETVMEIKVKQAFSSMPEEDFNKMSIDAFNKSASTRRVATLRSQGLIDLADYYDLLYKMMRSNYEVDRAPLREQWATVGSVNSVRRMANREATHASLLREREAERESRREVNRRAAERRIENAETKRQQIVANAKESLKQANLKGRTSTWNLMKYLPSMWGGKARKTRKNR